MNGSSFIRRSIASFLLLIFFQQMGAGLYIHNLVHNDKDQEQTHSRDNRAAKEISFACSCADNFLTPFIEGDELVVDQPFTSHTPATDSFSERIYFTSGISPSLRGPPFS